MGHQDPSSSSPSQSHPSSSTDSPSSIVKTYHRLLTEDPELTMPVAAIEALILLLSEVSAETVYETLDLVKTQSDYLKSQIPNAISLSAGTDLFQRYLLSSLNPRNTSGTFESVRQHLVNNGRLFASRAKAGRDRIAMYGRHIVPEGSVVMTHGGSRVVGALLSKVAEESASGEIVSFRVIYVMNDARSSESKAVVASLRAKGVPVATIPEGAVGYAMGKVDLVMVGAEGVVENGGIISRLGTYQIGLLAKAAEKPFYVAAESHKFVRLYPLDQFDLGFDQEVINFTTNSGSEPDKTPTKGSEKHDYFSTAALSHAKPAVDAVDYTPPGCVTALITESGVLTPGAVSEELINVWW
ncbi:putative translation initiation factor eIF-2B subunit alpha [Amylocarpus encephaloides]|uniref:Translation initiation factor eIF2B subunit alpha n=1 Tax=Amylocarpus encephaloides TaxID=45428 RepID=A0A9P8BZ88_9HELO|nr:putative translation initiation factor eIF-2B subunit alpha [Amylocarpus encephaloides]